MIIAVMSGVGGTLGKCFFAVTGENITMNVRINLYKSMLRKNLGWFD